MPEARTASATASTARSVQHVGDVVADSGQRAEVDLGEAQIGDRGEGGVEVQVPKADGGTSQPGVNHPHAVLPVGL